MRVTGINFLKLCSAENVNVFDIAMRTPTYRCVQWPNLKDGHGTGRNWRKKRRTVRGRSENLAAIYFAEWAAEVKKQALHQSNKLPQSGFYFGFCHFNEGRRDGGLYGRSKRSYEGRRRIRVNRRQWDANARLRNG